MHTLSLSLLLLPFVFHRYALDLTCTISGQRMTLRGWPTGSTLHILPCNPGQSACLCCLRRSHPCAPRHAHSSESPDPACPEPTGDNTTCTNCLAGTYGTDGLTCQPCPPGGCPFNAVFLCHWPSRLARYRMYSMQDLDRVCKAGDAVCTAARLGGITLSDTV
jgi:hypothetical protein